MDIQFFLLKGDDNIMYTFAMWTSIVNVYIILLPPFIIDFFNIDAFGTVVKVPDYDKNKIMRPKNQHYTKF